MKIKVKEIKPTVDLLKVNFLNMDKDLEAAHSDYIMRKSVVIDKLYTIWRNDEIPTLYRKWIREAAQILNEREI